MEILPRTMGTRPRLACEVRAEGVVAARADDASAVLAAVARVPLADGIVMQHFRGVDAGVTVASADGNSAATGVIGGVGGGAAGREQMVAAVRSALEAVSLKTREVTLVVPDSAVRVLLLDFDELPAKAAEALPVVRFRLKKLLPFDADDAAVSYQVMATTKSGMQVLAVAMPREVQTEYESVVREAGFEPGAILPSTLAALAGLEEGEMPMLVVNAGREGITTAIVKGGVLLLHRTVDLGAGRSESDAVTPGEEAVLEKVIEMEQANTHTEPVETSIAAIAARMAAAGTQMPVVVPEVIADNRIESSADAPTSEVAQAVSVAAAYFEDTLDGAPSVVLTAGTLGAAALTSVLDQAHVGPVAVQEIVSRQMLGAGATSAGTPAGVPLGWLAGVRGGAGELMRISINLATRPFVELRPLFARLRLAMAALAVLAIGLGITLHILNKNAAVAQAQMDDLKAQTTRFEMERQTNVARMKEPQNSEVLDRSKFLNTLFASKSFSWTSVMMDLERVLPAGVQVTSIDPTITAEGDINIRVRVIGDRDRAVDFVRNLEHSQRFLAPRLANETAQTQEPGRIVAVAQTGPAGVEFDILSGYNPLPAPAKASATKDKEPADDNASKTPPRAPKQMKPKTVVAGGTR